MDSRSPVPRAKPVCGAKCSKKLWSTSAAWQNSVVKYRDDNARSQPDVGGMPSRYLTASCRRGTVSGVLVLPVVWRESWLVACVR